MSKTLKRGPFTIQKTCGDGFNVYNSKNECLGWLTRNEALRLAKEIVGQSITSVLPFQVDSHRVEQLTRMMIAEALGLADKKDNAN
jgi:hypothetical protein